MSGVITALGQHTLPFLNQKALLTEISKRFEANVFLGFMESYDSVNDDLPTFRARGLKTPDGGRSNSEFYVLDEVHFPEVAKPFVLLMDDYEYQWMYDKFGEKAGYRKEFMKSWGNNPTENNKIIQGFLEPIKTLDFEYGSSSGVLSLESADVGLNEFLFDWNEFFYLITREYNYPDETFKQLLLYRNTNRETVLKLGGNCIYYHNDQGNNTGGAVQGNEWNMSWKEIEQAFNQPEVKKFQLNLGEALTNPTYLKQIRELTKNNFHDYSVFYDDFRELSMEDIFLSDN